MSEDPPNALAPGLYLVATPIGSARDITLRALDILAAADVLAAEDTRSARRLMEIHGIALAGRPLIAYHDQNGPQARPRVMAALENGKSVAYVSDAGTPLIADPGYQLVRAALADAHPVTAAPGPSAVLTALSLSGLPTDRFLFAGFPPPKGGARQRWLAELAGTPATLVMFESPKRIHRLLEELCQAWDADRPAALCRELTKRFEEVRRGPLSDLRDAVATDPPRGEIVLVVGQGAAAATDQDVVDAALRAALADQPVKAASAAVAAELGLPRRDMYQRALDLKKAEE